MRRTSKSIMRYYPHNLERFPVFYPLKHSVSTKEFTGVKKSAVRSTTSPITNKPKDKEFLKKVINRPRGIIKKVSIATMLAYSKVCTDYRTMKEKRELDTFFYQR